jgi:predicted dehydrogenase
MIDGGSTTERPLAWGVIGTGRIASAFVADLELTDSGSAVAVGSRSLGSADEFAARHGIPNQHASYADLAADPEIDAVYVATPHPMHRDSAVLALEAGKPVLVEKPFAMNASEAGEIAGLARERKLFAMEAMWTRFLPHMVEIRRLLTAGELGTIVSVSADHGQWFDEDPDSRLFAPALGGGALLDLGIYPVSFASMVLGPPDRVAAVVDPAFTGVDAQVTMAFGYESGAQASLACTLRARSPTRAAIVGTDARIEIDGDFYRPSAFELITRSGERSRFEPDHRGHGLRHQADEVARCLAGNLIESPVMPLDETVSIAATMDDVLAAAKHH